MRLFLPDGFLEKLPVISELRLLVVTTPFCSLSFEPNVHAKLRHAGRRIEDKEGEDIFGQVYVIDRDL